MDKNNAVIVLQYVDLEYEKEEKRLNKLLEEYSESIIDKIKELNSMIITFNHMRTNMKSHLNNINLFNENRVYEMNFKTFAGARTFESVSLDNFIRPTLNNLIMESTLINSNNDEEFMNIMNEIKRQMKEIEMN